MEDSPPEREGPSKGTAFTQTETFTYKPLDTKVDSIRLLKLKEGSDSDEIECELVHVTFASKPKYESLSYTWGSPDALQTIRINGCNFVIRENLYWALRNLRRVMEQPFYWIDAICINQDDVEERNRQVGLMAFIYSRAQNVLVWLGRPAIEGNINRYASGYPREIVCKWLARRDYWKRAWIVQEICLARNIQCFFELGNRQTSVNGWAEMIEALEMKAPDDAKPALKLYRQREARHEDSNLLEPLLGSFSDAKCSELRDKIYAFLGLCHDGQDGGLTVDYSKSLYDLYLEVIEFHYHSEPLLDGLLPAAIDREMRVVAFSKLLQQIFEDGVEDEIQRVGQMQLCKHREIKIRARAMIEGRILYLGPQYSDVVSSSVASKIWKSSFRKYYNKPQSLERLRKQDEAYTAVLLDMDVSDIARISTDPRPECEALALKRDWLCDEELPESEHRTLEMWERHNPDWRPEHLRPGYEPTPEPAVYGIAGSAAEPRRFLGSNTCMGLVNSGAAVGDFICRFWGCDVAAVLRPRSGGHFSVLGRVDMATGWAETEKKPTPISMTAEFEGGGVVEMILEAHELQKLTC